jgi:hypothetical protein
MTFPLSQASKMALARWQGASNLPTCNDIGGTGCRYPLWSFEQRPTHKFCGLACTSYLKNGKPRQSSYCKAHHDLTHLKAEVPLKEAVYVPNWDRKFGLAVAPG